MQSFEHLELLVLFGEGDDVELATLNGKTLFRQVSWSVVHFYINTLKKMGYELIDVSPIGRGEIYKFQQSKM